MKSICTSRGTVVAPVCSRLSFTVIPRQSFHWRARQKGTAEIETLLVIPVLLTLLFLAASLLKFGGARLANAYKAENVAYAQVVVDSNYTAASAPQPVEGIAAIRPTLPNRLVESAPTTQVAIKEGSVVVPPITLAAKAAFLDPAWSYSAYPHRNDIATQQAWFEEYVSESHPDSLNNALGVQPSWPP